VLCECWFLTNLIILNEKFTIFYEFQNRSHELSISDCVVIQLNASDEDEGENSRLRYEMVDDADDDVARLPLFAVDTDTGVVTAVAKLDRETSPQHRFQVRHLITVIQ